jgi:hypothetical protein
MLSPGNGAGNLASAISQIKTLHQALTKQLSAFASGSKEQQAVMRALSALNPVIKDVAPENTASAKRALLQGDASGGASLAGTPPGGVGSAAGSPAAPMSPTNPGAGIPSLASLGSDATM